MQCFYYWIRTDKCLLSRSVALLEKTPVSLWMLPLCYRCLYHWKFDKNNWWEFLNHKTCISILTLEFCCYRKKLKNTSKIIWKSWTSTQGFVFLTNLICKRYRTKQIYSSNQFCSLQNQHRKSLSLYPLSRYQHE